MNIAGRKDLWRIIMQFTKNNKALRSIFSMYKILDHEQPPHYAAAQRLFHCTSSMVPAWLQHSINRSPTELQQSSNVVPTTFEMMQISATQIFPTIPQRTWRANTFASGIKLTSSVIHFSASGISITSTRHPTRIRPAIVGHQQ